MSEGIRFVLRRATLLRKTNPGDGFSSHPHSRPAVG